MLYSGKLPSTPSLSFSTSFFSGEENSFKLLHLLYLNTLNLASHLSRLSSLLILILMQKKLFPSLLALLSYIFHNLGLMTVKIRSRMTRGVVVIIICSLELSSFVWVRMLGCCSFYFNLIISNGNGIYQFKIMSTFMLLQPKIYHIYINSRSLFLCMFMCWWLKNVIK